MAETDLGAGSAPGKRIPINGTVQLSVDDDGALIVLRLAIFLDSYSATDLCLRLIGHVSRVRGLGRDHVG